MRRAIPSIDPRKLTASCSDTSYAEFEDFVGSSTVTFIRTITMAPTEATILTNFLLPPASLPAVLTLRKFTSLFPTSQQSNPHIRSLYRDLQYQRGLVVDAVQHNIAVEVKRGNAQRRAVVRARREAEKEEQDDEIDIEHAVWLRLLTALWICANVQCSFSVRRPTFLPANLTL
jgi:hypothetical protein